MLLARSLIWFDLPGDGAIDIDDFNFAVAVSAPLLFALAEGDEKNDQTALEDEVYEEIKDDRVGEEGRRRRETDHAEKLFE